jgi:hypothetical protein
MLARGPQRSLILGCTPCWRLAAPPYLNPVFQLRTDWAMQPSTPARCPYFPEGAFYPLAP